MKWKTTIATLFILSLLALATEGTQLATGFISTEGSQITNGELMITARWPVYDYFIETCKSSHSVNITYPLNNSNFFFPNISPNASFNLTESSPNPTCQYRLMLNGVWYAWNNWSNCANGMNYKVITMPQGQPVHLQVRVDDACGSIYDAVDFNVYYPRPGVNIQPLDIWLVFGLMTAGLIVIVLEERRKRRIKPSR